MPLFFIVRRKIKKSLKARTMSVYYSLWIRRILTAPRELGLEKKENIMIKLTSKGRTAVATVKTTYKNLIAEGYNHQNAFGRTAHDRCGNLPASVIIFAIGCPSRDDYDDMRRQGYAE